MTLPELDSLKALAVSLLRAGNPAPDAYCESYNVTQVSACSGETRSTSRARIRPDGSVARFQYRSWNEGADPALGEFRGSLSPQRWTELIRSIAAMEWKEEPGMPSPSIPPSPTQPIQVLKLSDGKRTVSFSVAGPAPVSISAAMGAPDVLADSAADTVWSLSLSEARIQPVKKGIRFTAKWRHRGAVPVSILWPDSGGNHGCGKAILEWSGEDEASEARFDTALKPRGKARSWKPGKNGSERMEILFPYTRPEPGKKTGKLREFGVLVTPAGGPGQVPLTFFSDRIGF